MVTSLRLKTANGESILFLHESRWRTKEGKRGPNHTHDEQLHPSSFSSESDSGVVWTSQPELYAAKAGIRLESSAKPVHQSSEDQNESCNYTKAVLCLVGVGSLFMILVNQTLYFRVCIPFSSKKEEKEMLSFGFMRSNTCWSSFLAWGPLCVWSPWDTAAHCTIFGGLRSGRIIARLCHVSLEHRGEIEEGCHINGFRTMCQL